MHGEYGGMYITGGTVNFNALLAGAELGSTVGWTANTLAAKQHGSAGVVADPTTGRLTLIPGVYKIDATLTIEGNHSSGFSGDFAGVVVASLYRAGVLVPGTKAKIQTITEGLPMNAKVSCLVEITQAQQDAGTNYVSLYLAGQDASGNDVVITEGNFTAVRQS